MRGKKKKNPSSYDIVGDLIIINDIVKKRDAEKLLKQHKQVNVVLSKTRKYSGKYRLPKLKIICGERRKETTHKENNVRLELHPEKVYFSSRLATERKRIYLQVKNKENVLVMFSGCGVYPIVISKNTKAKQIYGVEINPNAHKYALENLKLNKVENVKLFLGDVRKIVPKINKKFDRVLMPLPKGAENYLDIALKAVKKKGIIHFYDFLHEDEFDKAVSKIDKACKKLRKKYKILNIVKCGQFSPRTYRVCVDFMVD